MDADKWIAILRNETGFVVAWLNAKKELVVQDNHTVQEGFDPADTKCSLCGRGAGVEERR